MRFTKVVFLFLFYITLIFYMYISLNAYDDTMMMMITTTKDSNLYMNIKEEL